MDRHQARFTKFGAVNSEHALFEIDVIAGQRQRFTHPQPGRCEQTEQTVVGEAWQPVAGGKVFGRCHEFVNLLRRVEIGPGACEARREQLGRRDLRARVRSVQMTRKSAYPAESCCLVRRRGMNGFGCPLKGELCSDATSATFFHEGYEVFEDAFLFPELTSQRSPQRYVLLQSLLEGDHRVPSGQGNATERNVDKSTLA